MLADRGSSVLTIDELAKYLKISKSTLYKLAQEGSIPGQKVGKHWRFHKDAVGGRQEAFRRWSGGERRKARATRATDANVGADAGYDGGGSSPAGGLRAQTELKRHQDQNCFAARPPFVRGGIAVIIGVLAPREP